jgi:hypothetical protein
LAALSAVAIVGALLQPNQEVAKMTSAFFSARLGAEFDAFLFAPIGNEANGHPLSVISALARLDLDPWQEAVSLSNLSALAATQRLTSLIATLPGGLANHFPPAAIAARLAGLLPTIAVTTEAKRQPDADDRVKLKSGLVMGGVFFLVVLGSQWVAGYKDAPVKLDNQTAHSSSIAAPAVPLSR